MEGGSFKQDGPPAFETEKIMKANKLTLLPLVAAMLAISPAAQAQDPELDMTMTIMEEGQEPANLVQKIHLPSPAEIGVRDDVVVERSLGSGIADEVREQSNELTEEAVGTVTDNIKDVLSIDGVEGVEDLPGDIVDNLSEDLPLLDDDALPDPPDLPNLPDLPLGSSRDSLPQDVVQEAGEVIDGVGNDAADAVNDTVDGVNDAADGVKDVGSELGETVEEARKLLP
jgi:hypothetical protein